MIDKIYDLFTSIGYVHPLHPGLTHAPIGGVMVGFLLVVTWFWRKKEGLMTSSYHAICVAFVLILPTIVVGVLDWQHYYSGAWIFPIQMKMALALLLFVLLSITLIVGRKPNVRPVTMLSLCTLCLFNVMGLGYFGGELIYGDRSPKNGEEFQTGRKIFINHCSGCHVNGGNIFFPNLPLHSAPQLESYQSFIEFMRNPTMPDGTKGPMPSFTPAKLSDQEAHELYDYIVNRIAKTKRVK